MHRLRPSGLHGSSDHIDFQPLWVAQVFREAFLPHPGSMGHVDMLIPASSLRAAGLLGSLGRILLNASPGLGVS